MKYLRLLLLIPLLFCSACGDTTISTQVVKSTPAEAPTESTYKLGGTLWKADKKGSNGIEAREQVSISSLKPSGDITLLHWNQVGGDNSNYRTDTAVNYPLTKGETIKIATNLGSKKVQFKYADVAADGTLSIRVTEE